MKVLPSRTLPPETVIERRHAPRRGAYITYRPCLRWEFGHSCAFCLTHEADLIEHGVEGTGLTSIEHQIPQSVAAELIDVYENCFYVCRFCNGARGTQPNEDEAGRKLLEPCRNAWAEHFERIEDRLVPRRGDDEAARTYEVYDLDDPRKREMRRTREDIIKRALRLLRQSPEWLDRLLSVAVTSGDDRADLLDAADAVRDHMHRARADLKRFGAIPFDADVHCRCPSPQPLTSPQYLETQLVEFPD